MTSDAAKPNIFAKLFGRRKRLLHDYAQELLRQAATEPSVARSHLAGSGSPLTLATNVKTTDTVVKLVEPGLDAFPESMRVGEGSVLEIDGEHIQIRRVIDRCTLQVTRGVMG